MKKVLLSTLAIAGCLNTFAQSKTFAITSENKGEFTWTAIRELDFTTGEFTKTLFTKKPTTVATEMKTSNGATINDQNFINGRGVAAAAFDAKTNRLFFSEMYGNTLKFVDVKNSKTGTLNVGECTDARFSTGAKKQDESNVITRMAIANDGFGYALTNDANSLIRFSTGENPTITNLGGLRDSRKNKDISIHSQCTCWGGDMIGDVYGNLYLITMRNNVFKINVSSMEAEFIGAIKNLPNTFTTNGAAADDDGNILLSSASNADCYFKVNASTLEATKINAGKDLFNVSDLANSNLVYQQRKSSNAGQTVATNLVGEINIFPNPTVGKNFSVALNKLEAGNYNINVTDVNGKTILMKQINVTGASMEKITMPKSATGMYMLRVSNKDGKVISTQKLMVD